MRDNASQDVTGTTGMRGKKGGKVGREEKKNVCGAERREEPSRSDESVERSMTYCGSARFGWEKNPTNPVRVVTLVVNGLASPAAHNHFLQFTASSPPNTSVHSSVNSCST